MSNMNAIEFENNLGDGIQVIDYGNGKVYFDVHSDWAGCTETGFGESCGYELGIDDLVKLHEFIGGIIDEATKA
jgi:hypothetical protein